MIQEDYVSFELAKLLDEMEFNGEWHKYYWGYKPGKEFLTSGSYNPEYDYPAPTLQMAMKWLREVHNILLVVDYEYEYDSTPYLYKTYRLGENGKPEKVAVKGISYDDDDNPTEHIVGYRHYERSYKDYITYENAAEDGIKYCLENLI